ncbi:MAG: sigma-70 family RNA polymerase sigma factor [Ignavibacteriae bacterium]|nr:sigma-70 family RNA polymerase sigma factor [Ignavibacteriota bacterium]MCB9216031.1 sigma-70 family RNA polymerase sigma factor [Ignavibacteria bacterium]
MVELDDKELLELYHSGQKERMFNELVRRYQKRIYWVARRMVKRHEDADDIAQDVFVKAYTALEGFRGDSNIYTWLYRIAVNLSINHLRKQKVRNAVDLDDYLPFLSKDADQDKKMMRRENVSLIEEAIATLPEKQRAVFIMRYYDEMPYEQISAILGTTVGGLKANFHHAVKKVAAYVKQNHGSLNVEDAEGLLDDDEDDL